MKLWGTRWFQTVVGKTIAGVVVVMVGVGAAAAGGAEVPLLTTASADESGDVADEEAEDDGDDQVDEKQGDDASDQDGSPAGDDAADGSDEAEEAEEAEELAEVDEVASPDEASSGEETHGDVVSEFTRTTDLVGCEKGQATAAVARRDVDPSAADLDEQLAPYLERCDGDGDDVQVDERDADPDGWKSTRDDGRAARDEARRSLVEVCGDEESDDAPDGEDDGGKSAECQQLHEVAKQAHADWKDAWHAERDAAVGRRGPKDDAAAPDDDAASTATPAVETGPPDHSNAGGKQGGQGKAKGNGKP